MDLESFARSIRSSRHEIGGRMREVLANADGGEYQGWTLPWGQSHQDEFVECRNKGSADGMRSGGRQAGLRYGPRMRHRLWSKRSCPRYRGTSESWGERRMMSRVGFPRSFELGPEDLYKLAGIRVSAKEVERVSEMGAGRKKSFRQARQRRAYRPDCSG